MSSVFYYVIELQENKMTDDGTEKEIKSKIL